MQIIDVLTEKQIVADLRAINRWEAIHELTDRLIAAGKVRPAHREAIIAAVRKRESSMSTGIGCGIALPHATTELVPELMAALGRSRRPVDFDALDGEPASIVILLLVPHGRLQAHLHTLASTTRLLQDAVLREAIAEAPDAKEILRILRSHSGAPFCRCT